MKKLINLSLACIITPCLFTVSYAQNSFIQLGNGITVVIKTEVSPRNSTAAFGNIYSSNSSNIIHRVLTDRTNKIYFGYDLLIEKQEEAGKFRVSIKPLSKKPDALLKNSGMPMQGNSNTRAAVANSSGNSQTTGPIIIGNSNYKDYTEISLPNYPKDIILEDGDVLTLDLLENPKTKAKISDLIKIPNKTGQSSYYFSTDTSPKTYSIEDVMLRIERPDIYINNKKYETASTVAGNINWIYINGKGRFIFSFQPQPNYNFQKIGNIKNNELSYEFNGDKYRFVSRTPVLGQGGNWNLWIMHDPDYKATYKVSDGSPFIFGAAGKVSNLFQRR